MNIKVKKIVLETSNGEIEVDAGGAPLEHYGHYTVEMMDAYEALIGLGKDYTMKLTVDADAVENSGYFGSMHG
jgi:hypothetical protein